ncbi:MAG: hypothetical protein AB2L21_10695 [Anaerolineaceae bacterium]|jgi:hypothetical protein
MVDSVEQKLDATTQDVDGGGKEATPSQAPTMSKINQPTLTKDNPGFAKFKSAMAKRHCSVCGQTFNYDLVPYYDGKVGSYRCFECAMKSLSSSPAKTDPQTAEEST